MRYTWESFTSFSYWRYALLSKGGLIALFSIMAGMYVFIDIADAFKIYTKDKYSSYGFLLFIVPAIAIVLITRRPLSKIRYKIPNKDYVIEVKIGNIFEQPGQLIISSNTTFDTNMSSGLISANSLQGQFAGRFFNGQTDEIDRQISQSLLPEQFIVNEDRPGNKKEYPLGTVAKISSGNRHSYFVAMSHLNESGTAFSTPRMMGEVLENLWVNLGRKAEFGDLVIPVMGTGRGRIQTPRKKVIEQIAQSFADASNEKLFSNKLTIMVRPEDAAAFSLNLFQVRDYLAHSLQT